MESPNHAYIKDAKGAYLESNLAQTISFGLKKSSDVIGMTDKDFLSESEASTLRTTDTNIIKSERPIIAAEICTFPNKAPTIMISHKMPLKNKAGKVIAVFGTSTPLENLLSNGSESFSPFQEIQATLISFLLPQKINQVKILSKREKECLQYLTRGMTAKQIARILNLSPRTIEFYIENMKNKLECHNRIELVAKAIQNHV
jgi:DNA-binding CsgD family transcriptional regulator